MKKSNSFFHQFILAVVCVIFGFISGSCSNDAPYVPTTAIKTDTVADPAQYGTPYSAVPEAPDAVIYQVNMRVFSATRNFQGVINRLDSIKSLGVNVIYLMPIYPVGTLNAFNSPYCVKDYRSVNTEFGTLQDLRNLIDAAHSKGMAVILDWVANHTSWDNAWITAHPAWYQHNTSGTIVSPSGWTDVAQLDFSNADMRKAMIKNMKFWVFTANCDGFRCDYADGPPATFWKQAIDTLRNIKTHKLLMMAEGSRTDHYTSGFDFIFGFNFYGQMKSIYSSGQSVLTIDNFNTSEYYNAGTYNRVVRYITNHDVNGSDGTPLELFGGTQGSMAAFVVAAYMKSVPMIYNGQEVGTTFRITFPFTGTVINWASNYGMEAEYKKLITFRNNNIAIRRGTLASYSSTDVCAFTKTYGSETVLVLSNLRNKSVTYTLPTAISNSNWTNGLTGESVSLTSQITLPAYNYLILKK
jgi:glycosidase